MRGHFDSHPVVFLLSGSKDRLAITGRVLPVTNENVQLKAVFENGASVVGESHIARMKAQERCRIAHVELMPEHPQALSAALNAIEQADVILLAPGSLYTSIIPNLLVDGIVDAIVRSTALKIYICNVMTQPGETEGYTVADHIRALFAHSCPGLFRICLVNSQPIPTSLSQRYAMEGAEVILCDQSACEALGVEVISRPVSTVENGCVRHSPGHLARELMAIHTQRSMRVVGESTRHSTTSRVEE